MIRIMGIVSLVCGLLIVAAHRGTLEPIRRNQELIMQETVAQLLPGVAKQITYAASADGELKVWNEPEPPPQRIIAGYDSSGALIGVVLQAAERGYADMIVGMYAYSPAKQAVIGFKVVEMKETPGLGDKISTDPRFLSNFRELDATHPIVTVKSGTKKNAWEVDAISGATISSRAVGRMLQKSTKQMAPVIARNRARLEKGE